MKITQEVRDFAACHNAPTVTFLAAEDGMAKMSAKFRERGGELYVVTALPYKHEPANAADLDSP
jgi:phosphomethylpyrimidine synthase